jgi:uncharacterized RDD family membrane protein YckC
MQNQKTELVGVQKPKSFFWLRLFSTIIDFSVISSLAIIIHTILLFFMFISYIAIWVTILILYYACCYYQLNGVTLGRLLTGLQLVSIGLHTLSMKQILIRELILKGIVLIIIPAYISEYGFSKQTVFFDVLVYSLVFLISILLLLIIQKTWWELISKQCRNKSLVIMNTWHGYGHIGKRFPQSIQDEFHGTTAYLQEAFPGKVANVMIHTVTQKYGYMFTPIHNGKWDRVFEDLGNREAGFDFLGSPFGEELFDLAFIAAKDMLFKDVFTGYIFYKPLTLHLKKESFPYEFNNFEDTMIRRASILNGDYVASIKEQIDDINKNPNDAVSSETFKYSLLYNSYLILWGSIKLLLSFVIALFFYRRKRKLMLLFPFSDM